MTEMKTRSADHTAVQHIVQLEDEVERLKVELRYYSQLSPNIRCDELRKYAAKLREALEKIERLPYDEVPDHHQNIAHDALALKEPT